MLQTGRAMQWKVSISLLFQVGLRAPHNRLPRRVSQLCPLDTGHVFTRRSVSCALRGSQRHLASAFPQLDKFPNCSMSLPGALM